MSNIMKYEGDLRLCENCDSHPECNVVGEHGTYQWATEFMCPKCHKTFFLCGLCLPSAGFKVSQLQKKRLKRHSNGINHQNICKRKRVNMEDIIEESLYDHTLITEEESLCDKKETNDIIVENMETVTYFNREESNEYFSFMIGKKRLLTYSLFQIKSSDIPISKTNEELHMNIA